MARFMAALAYMFDERMEEFAEMEASSESMYKRFSLDGTRWTALKCIEYFIFTLSSPQALAAAAAGSSSPAALTPVTESVRIQEAGHLRCSESEIGRFIAMVQNPSSIVRSCAIFALLQFTMPGSRHPVRHVKLLQNAGAPLILREPKFLQGLCFET